MLLVSSCNLLQSFNYAPYLFCKKLYKSDINCFCIRTQGIMYSNKDDKFRETLQKPTKNYFVVKVRMTDVLNNVTIHSGSIYFLLMFFIWKCSKCVSKTLKQKKWKIFLPIITAHEKKIWSCDRVGSNFCVDRWLYLAIHTGLKKPSQ